MLMEHVTGVETGVGAYFNGEEFLLPACLDWEHKRFFAGDMGELTGEMGTIATFDKSRKLFELILEPLEQILRDHGHVGYVNVNTIVNDRGIWPLEFTCRFGYPGFSILEPLQKTSWADLFRAIARRGAGFAARPGFSAGIVLTTPPFPYSRKQVAEPVGLPVFLPEDLDEEDRRNFHYGEVGLDESGQLVTSGLYGWTMVATGTGRTIEAARAAAYERAARVSIPNLRYRLDIGDKLIAGDYAALATLGLLSDDWSGTSADR
jgi:phosphoribosylamine--glycine ligase